MRQRSLFVVALLAALVSNGCLFRSHRVPTRTTITGVRTTDLPELVDTLNARANAIKTLNATVDIDTAVGGAKKGKVTEYQEIRGYILVRKPDQIRMIGLLPVVRNRAFDMVSDAQGFKLYIPPKNKFIVGPLEVTHPSPNPLENLRPNVIYDALVVPGVDSKDELAVLENTSEIVTDAKTKKEVELPTYTLDIIHHGKEGWYLSRRIIFSRIDLLPSRQLEYDKNGNLVTITKYANYKDFNSLRFPATIEIQRPQEEYTIGLNVLKLNLNEPLKDDQFALAQPAGAQLVHIDPAGTTTETPGGDGEKKQ